MTQDKDIPQEPPPKFSSYLDSYNKRGRWLSPTALAVWLGLHIAAYLAMRCTGWGAYLLTPFIISSSLIYVRLIHRLDEDLKAGGLRSLLQLARSASSGRKQAGTPGERGVRQSIRLQTVAIGGGFGTTFFILVLQMYQEGSLTTAPWMVAESMMVLFPTSAILNLLQLVIYDFLVAEDWSSTPFQKQIRAFCVKRVRSYRFYAWHFMITPSILALSMFSEAVCLIFNLVYGGFLWHYYFVTGRRMRRIELQIQSSPYATAAADSGTPTGAGVDNSAPV